MAETSVVILTANRKALLEATLRSIENQTHPPLEVIVVDNGSTDGTKDFLTQNAWTIPLRVIDGPGSSYAESRNAGVNAAQGEYVLFLDDDCEADHFALDRLVNAARANHWLAVGAVVLPADELEAPDGFSPDINWAAGLQSSDIFGPLAGREHLPTTAMILVNRRTAQEFSFQEVGGRFAGESGTYDSGREDAEWWRRLRRAGLRVGVEKRALAWHHVPQARLDIDTLNARARADGRAHWLRERLVEELRPAAHDIVRFPVNLLHDAFSQDVTVRQAWEHHLLWTRRQWAFLSAAVDDYHSHVDPPRRLAALLTEGAGVVASVGKAAVRSAVISLTTPLRHVPPLPAPEDQPENLLVVLHDLLGDAVLAIPMVRQLAAAYPQTRITLLTGPVPAPLLRANVPGNVDIMETRDAERSLRGAKRLAARLAPLEPEATILAYTHNLCPAALFMLNRSPVVSWQQDNGMKQRLWAEMVHYPVTKSFRKAEAVGLLDLLAPFGVRTRAERPRLEAGEQARARWSAALERAGLADKEYAVVHIEAEERFKFWPADRMAEICRRLAGEGLTVFLTGLRNGRRAWEKYLANVPECISLHGLQDTAEIAAMLEKARLFVGCDSGPSHIAQAVGCPSIVLFGMTEIHRWGPLPQLAGEATPPAVTVLTEAPGDWLVSETRGLPANQGMHFLTVGSVWTAVQHRLANQENCPPRDETH